MYGETLSPIVEDVNSESLIYIVNVKRGKLLKNNTLGVKGNGYEIMLSSFRRLRKERKGKGLGRAFCHYQKRPNSNGQCHYNQKTRVKHQKARVKHR